jgi:glycosyltransferase involved in cell wall biosynthesis
MRYLFVHQNFPGQYRHVVAALREDPRNEIVFITQKNDNRMHGVRRIEYAPSRAAAKTTHHYVRDIEAGVLNAQAVARLCVELKKTGFVPDVMIGHAGWGETLFLKDFFPDAPLLAYFEFFYHLHGADVGFDPLYPVTADDGPRLRMKNAINLLALESADWGQTPTAWQRSLFPAIFQPRISAIHEGIDTARIAPDPGARFAVGDRVLTPGDPVVTFVARNLEPYRGFPQFMRALRTVLKRRPDAHVLIAGGGSVSYGRKPPSGRSWRDEVLDEVAGDLDMSRVHLLGRVPYERYLALLHVSSVHVYLTYPFVLSWSMLEAMAAGCLVLGSATPPVQEVVRDGENGLLVDFFATEAITDRIVAALDEPSAFAGIRAAARQTVVDRYDLATVCLPRHLDLIGTLARHETPAPEPQLR